jgi:hypothetical protein
MLDRYAQLVADLRAVQPVRDGSSLGLDVSGKDIARAFKSGEVPHLARAGRNPATGVGVHDNDNGIAVPAGSSPAHIPLGKRQDLLNREQVGRRPRNR